MRWRDLVTSVLVAGLAGACGGSSSETPPPLAPELEPARAKPEGSGSERYVVQTGPAGAASANAGSVEPAPMSTERSKEPEATWGARRRRR